MNHYNISILVMFIIYMAGVAGWWVCCSRFLSELRVGNVDDEGWFLTDDDMEDWCIISEDGGKMTEVKTISAHSSSRNKGTSVFFTSNLFQNTKGRLYNAIRGW